jgi:phenylpyruvate tautomerase PptA (4-oxalocrotonate tautomerase family)
MDSRRPAVPIIEIRALPQRPDVDRRAALSTLCTAVASQVDMPAHAVWGTWQELAPGDYVEGANAPSVQPDSTHPPLVRLFAFEGRSQPTIEKMITLVADVLSRELRMEKGNVFVLFIEGKSGRVYSGGGIVRKKPAKAHRGKAARKPPSRKRS